ncbi:MAG: hypothetical protein KBG49_10965 [Spirochaetes bacterium]|nr:hypothetical protein [Spirochaetota bacterium]
MASERTGSLLSVAGSRVWKGDELTNGFLMRNADGRVPAITQSGIITLNTNSLYASDMTIPFGCGVFRRLNLVNSSKQEVNNFVVDKQGGAALGFAGIIKYEQGWAESNPIKNWGVPAYSKFTLIVKGIVGFKYFALVENDEADFASFFAFIKGDKTKRANVEGYAEVLAKWQLASATTTNIHVYLAFSTANGMPLAYISDRNNVTPPFNDLFTVGRAVLFEPENETIYFELIDDVYYQ